MFSYRRPLPAPPAFDPHCAGLPSVATPSISDDDTTAAIPRPTDGDASRTAHGREITVLLIDDTPLTRECLSISLALCDRGLHVLTAASPADVQAMLDGTAAPDVVLCHLGGTVAPDAPLPAMVRDLVAVLGRIPLIVLCDHEDTAAALDAFRMGVRGYIPASVGLSVALEAIRLVGAGGTFIPAAFLQRLMQDRTARPADPRRRPAGAASDPEDGPRNGGDGSRHQPEDRLHDLTPRQAAVLDRLREGKANKVIAYELGMCESTVKVHVRNILKRLGATNRTQAAYLTYTGQPQT